MTEKFLTTPSIGSLEYLDENWEERILRKYKESIPNITFDTGKDKDDTSKDKQLIDPNFSLENLGSIAPLPRYQFILKQKWVGYVIDVFDDTFLARLVTIVGEGSEIEAEIYIEEVSEQDHDLIELGATFYWSIGYNDTSGRQRVSEIRFRRLPPWTEEELHSANAEAASIRALFDEE